MTIIKKRLTGYFDSVISSKFWTEGCKLRQFEDTIENKTGKHAVTMNSAGSCLYTLYTILHQKGKKLVVPNNTFYATGGMAREAGWDLILADCGLDFSMSHLALSSIEDTGDIAGVVLTHVGGVLAKDYTKIAEYCKSKGWFLIEDAAHAVGVTENGVAAGDLGLAAVYSFYPTKAIPIGEGGAVVTKDKDLAEQCSIFRNYGKTVVDGVVQYSRGFNFRMDEWTACVGLAQFEDLDNILYRRNLAAQRLAEIIPPLPPFTGRVSNWYKYPVSLTYKVDKTVGKIYAKTDQLESSMGLADQGFYLPVSSYIASSHQCLPLGENMYDGMSDEDIIVMLGVEDGISKR